MANDKDFIVKNAVEVGGSVKTTLGTLTSGSEGYLLSSASYDNKSKLVNQDPTPRGIYFKSDGTKFFIAGNNQDEINDYDCSTAWDISTATYNQSYVTTNTASPMGVFFNPAGTKMFVIDGSAPASVDEYSLSTAWDQTSATYVDSLDTSSQSADFGLTFNGDGTSLYVGTGTGTIYQYNMTTAYDVSTGSYASKSLSVSGVVGNEAGFAFNNDGTKLFVVAYTGMTVYQYGLTTAYDISTATSDSVNFSLSSEATTATNGMTFGNSGTKMYVISFGDDTLYQYSTGIATQTVDLSTGNYFNHTLTEDTKFPLSNAGDVQSFQLEVTGGFSDGYVLSQATYENKSFDASSQVSAGRDVRFKSDGTKMYLLANSGDTIYQYALSTAWDVTTASYDSKSFATTSEDTSPSGFYLTSSGTKLYVVGTTDTVHQYTLSTAWDISTASFDNKEKSVSSQDSTPQSVALNPTGTKMFVTGNSNSRVYEYTLSTAFDVSTATYSTFLSVVSSPRAIEFNDTGTEMYIVSQTGDNVQSYTLPTAYSLSGGSSNEYLFLRSENDDLRGVTFGDSGKRMYTMDDATESVYQYTVANNATITWPSSIEWASGTAPTVPESNKKDLYTFTTDDGGTTYYGFTTAQELS